MRKIPLYMLTFGLILIFWIASSMADQANIKVTYKMPKPEAKTATLLVIPMELINTTESLPESLYQFYLKGIPNPIKLDPRHPFAYITGLKPGKYRGDKTVITFKDNSTHIIACDHFRFLIESEKIKILREMFQVTISKVKEKNYWIYQNPFNTRDNKERLEKIPNHQFWKGFTIDDYGFSFRREGSVPIHLGHKADTKHLRLSNIYTPAFFSALLRKTPVKEEKT